MRSLQTPTLRPHASLSRFKERYITMENLIKLQNMSNKYGKDSNFVLAGGGNTSYKDETTLYVKGSGTSLATIKAEDFVRLDREKLGLMWAKTYSSDEKTRESEVLADMMEARLPGEARRPSVETLLHNLFPQKFVLHVHPSAVNGMTCGKAGKSISEKLFPESVWVDACKPGYILADICRTKLCEYREKTGKDVDLLFLQNHGVFFAADSVEKIDALAEKVMNILDSVINGGTDFLGKTLSEAIGAGVYEYLRSPEISVFDASFRSPTPDHIVYCKANYLVIDYNITADDVAVKIAEFETKNGYKPRVVIVKGQGAFVFGVDAKQLETVKSVFLDHVQVVANAKYFGGYFAMSEELVDFIVNWEVESYRAKVSGN